MIADDDEDFRSHYLDRARRERGEQGLDRHYFLSMPNLQTAMILKRMPILQSSALKLKMVSRDCQSTNSLCSCL